MRQEIRPKYELKIDTKNSYKKYFQLIEIYRDSVLVDFIRYDVKTKQYALIENRRIWQEDLKHIISQIEEQFNLSQQSA
jgi:hypothetical protein